MLRRHRAALAASTALLAACGPKWPAVHSLADPAFAGGGPGSAVGTIDILPIDMQVWSSPDAQRSPDELAGPLHEMVAGDVAARLAEHGYTMTLSASKRRSPAVRTKRSPSRPRRSTATPLSTGSANFAA